MAKTTVEFEKVKTIANNIHEESQKVKSALNKCDSIIDENVCVANRWTGQRAKDFKNKFKNVSADFNKYVEQIDSYVDYINKAYAEFKKVDETKN